MNDQSFKLVDPAISVVSQVACFPRYLPAQSLSLHRAIGPSGRASAIMDRDRQNLTTKMAINEPRNADNICYSWSGAGAWISARTTSPSPRSIQPE